MNVIAEFSDDNGLNVKLTADKIYINTIGKEETFALRGLNGIGIYDDIKKYNSDLNKIKSENSTLDIFRIGLIAFSSFLLLNLLWDISEIIEHNPASDQYVKLSFVVISISLSFFIKRWHNKSTPQLDSYLKIILSSGDRNFRFNKDEKNAKNIAQFINQVEDTLTAYSSKS
jgi:hypothetical protein